MAAVALVGAAGIALAGCGSGAPQAARVVDGTARPLTDGTSPGPSAGGWTSPSAQRAPSRAAEAQQVPGRCHTSDLKASVGPNDPGAGQENYALVLTNSSGRTCTVHGFPGFAFVDGAGKRVAPDPKRTGAAAPVVRLAPGQSAWAALSFPNPGVVGGATVTPVTAEITPPDEHVFLQTPWSGGPVSKQPPSAAASHVGPFRPGTGPGR